MDGWLGFNNILSTQVEAISCLRDFSLLVRPMACIKDYLFRMNVIEEIFEINFVEKCKVCNVEQYMYCITQQLKHSL